MGAISLGPLLGDQTFELALLEQLGNGANRKAQGGHGGAQAKTLLDGLGGPHFVVAQTDPESARLPVARRSVAAGTATPIGAGLARWGVIGHRRSHCNQAQVCRIGWPRGVSQWSLWPPAWPGRASTIRGRARLAPASN